MYNIVFMGTPEFAVPALSALTEMYDVVAVYTRPDKPAGRGRTVAESPVKVFARAHGIAVEQPRTLRKEEPVERLRQYAPDLIVVAAYGLILPQSVLDLPPYHCINTHASLLPRHRGAAPITAALLAGDAETGVTLMQMEAGLDTGPIISRERIPIAPDDTTGSLSAKLAHLGAAMLRRTLPRWFAGEIAPQPQPEEGVTMTRLVTKEEGQIDWNRPAAEIERMTRAYDPWPGAFTRWNGKMLKIVRGTAVRTPAGEAGQVIAYAKGAAVYTGEGGLELRAIQLEGKRAMGISEFLRGYPHLIGSTLA